MRRWTLSALLVLGTRQPNMKKPFPRLNSAMRKPIKRAALMLGVFFHIVIFA